MVMSHGAPTSPDMSQVVSLVEDFRASFYSSSSSEMSPSVSNAGRSSTSYLFLKAFIGFPAIGVAILVPSRSATWYVKLSIVLVTTYGPNHCFANYAWTDVDC